MAGIADRMDAGDVTAVAAWLAAQPVVDSLPRAGLLRAAGDELIEDDPHRVDVGPRVELLAARLLGWTTQRGRIDYVMTRAGAGVASADRITLLRDVDGATDNAAGSAAVAAASVAAVVPAAAQTGNATAGGNALVDITPPDPDAFIAGRFAGKTFIVTGSARGMGKAAAIRLAREGGNVVGVDWIKDMGEATDAEIRAAGGKSAFVHGDIGDAATADAAGGGSLFGRRRRLSERSISSSSGSGMRVKAMRIGA